MSNRKITYYDDHFEINGKTYSVEWFRQEYLIDRRDKNFFLRELGIKSSSLTNIASRYNLRRGPSPVQKLEKDFCIINGIKYTKEWFYEEYIVKGRVSEGIQKELQIGRNIFYSICKEFDISRIEENHPVCYADYFIINGVKIMLSDFLNIYISEKNSIDFTRRYFNLSKNNMAFILKYYKIQKTREQKVQARDKTVMKRYGCSHVLKNPEFKAKREHTCLERWGNAQPLRSEKFRKQQLETFGYTYHCQRNMTNYEFWQTDEAFIDFLKQKKRTLFELGEFFNIDPAVPAKRVIKLGVEHLIKHQGGWSKYEDEIYTMLIKEFHIPKEEVKKHVRRGIFEDKDDHREIDIYLPKYKMGIEFNGDFWHSDIQANFQDHNGRSRTHQKKALDAEKSGIFIFSIFQYEWRNPTIKENIKNRLRSLFNLYKRRIGARKCKIVKLTKKEKKEFLSLNHIQGNDRSTVAYGLEYNGELVSCMSFVKPKTKYAWELSRFCTKHDTVVLGGASKLFSYFVREFLKDGESVVSYNDITKSKGDIYPLLGFALKSINPPNYIWKNFNTNDIRTRYQEQKAGEVERMHSQGYHRICDCGTKTWVFQK